MKNCEVIFEIDQKEKEVEEYEKMTVENNFWNDQEKAQEIMRQLNSRKNVVDKCNSCKSKIDDLILLTELSVEENDQSSLPENKSDLTGIQKKIETLDFQKMLGKDDDNKNPILTIHPGDGGTESQD